ncbi:MAG: PEP-CTERM sorting domain-containing protein [Planctomycetota bacterium]
MRKWKIPLLSVAVFFLAAFVSYGDYTSGLIARYDFEWGDGSDSWGSYDLEAVNSPVIVSDGLLNQWWGFTGDPEWVGRHFLLVDTDAGWFEETFADGSPMDLGTSTNDGSFTIWVRATGSQHRWANQQHYVRVRTAGDATYERIYRFIGDQTYNAADDIVGTIWEESVQYNGILMDHGGTYYTWPDVHGLALIWDGSAKCMYGWNDVIGRVPFMQNPYSEFEAGGDATWILGAFTRKEVLEWQCYVDEVRYYDHALSDVQLGQIVARDASTIGDAPWATYPNPADNSPDVSPLTTLSWLTGLDMINQEVYLGTNESAVTDANTNSPEHWGQTTDSNIAPELLDSGKEHFWRVDTIDSNSQTIKGKIWSFTTALPTASNPIPDDNSINISPDIVLQWIPAPAMDNQEVYLGTDESAVSDANTNSPEYQQATTGSSFDPCGLATSQEYFWRIDTIADGNTFEGQVWSFTTWAPWEQTDNLIARWDFEDPCNRGKDSWSSYDLATVGSPIFVDGVGGEEQGAIFMLVDTDAGKLQGTFADGLPIDLGTSADTSFTIWVRATGPQHRWVNQTHYVYADNAGDATHDDTRRYIYDQTYSTAEDGFGDFQAGAWTAHYAQINHGGDYYSWPDVHDMAYIWDGSTNTAYGWNDVTGLVTFVNENHNPLYAYGDVTWILGAKHGDKGVAEWQSYIDEVRYYNSALTVNELGQIVAVPEPATMLLLTIGAGLVASRRKR